MELRNLFNVNSLSSASDDEEDDPKDGGPIRDQAKEDTSMIDNSIDRMSNGSEEFLPCWKWDDNSCSLDAVLLISLRVHQELGALCHGLGETEPIYTAWRTVVETWQKRGTWVKYLGRQMNETRNSMRDLLKAGGLNNGRSMIIGMNSSVVDTLSIFIPPSLTKVTVKTVYECTAPIHTGEPVQADKTRILEHLCVQGHWAKNSSTQEMLKNLVRKSDYVG